MSAKYIPTNYFVVEFISIIFGNQERVKINCNFVRFTIQFKNENNLFQQPQNE